VNFEAFIVSAPSQPGENHGKTLPKNDPVCGDQISLGEWTFDEFRHYASEEHVSLADTLNAFSEELLKTARERAEAMGARSVEVETLTETRGYGISGSILDAVHAWKADMVVMGRRGRGLISGLLIGSVSQRVSSMADRPVVLVP